MCNSFYSSGFSFSLSLEFSVPTLYSILFGRLHAGAASEKREKEWETDKLANSKHIRWQTITLWLDYGDYANSAAECIHSILNKKYKKNTYYTRSLTIPSANQAGEKKYE